MNSVINAYAQAKDVEGAERVLGQMREMGLHPDEVTMSSVINAHAQAKDAKGAERVLGQMREMGLQLNEFTKSSVINANAQAKDAEGAERVLGQMREMGLRPNAVTMSSVLKAQVAASHGSELLPRLLKTLQSMEELGIEPNSFSYFQLLLGCRKTRNREQAIKWFDQLLLAGVEPIDLLCNVLTQTVGKKAFEEFKAAREQLFEEATQRARQKKRNKNYKGSGGGARAGADGRKKAR